MSDITDISDTFNNSLFKLACRDVETIVSIVTLESKDFHKQPTTFRQRIIEKSLFFGRFFYLVFFKGFKTSNLIVTYIIYFLNHHMYVKASLQPF